MFYVRGNGPLHSVTIQQLYTSIAASVIIFPPVLVITAFFSKSELKESEQKHESQQRESSYASGSNNERSHDGKRTRHSKKLPYWCNYIAWLLVALCIACGAFFTILYALQWGKTKSEAWLITFFLSFFESVLLLQPLKV